MSLESDTRELLAGLFPGAQPANVVGGQWHVRATTELVDPSTGEVFTTAPVASADDVTRAVDAAQAAHHTWARLSVLERARHLAAFARALKDRGDDIARLESVDSGNPLPSTRRDIGLALKYLEHWPAWALAQHGRSDRPYRDGLSYTLREPYGVVGRIVAYNHPMLFAVAGMILPLLAGNTMVIKAAPQTPLGTLALGKVFEDSLPPGLVNLVAGGADTGDALVTDPRIKRLSFVGSQATAVAIQNRLGAGGTVKHLTTELGGKSAMIVSNDVDLEAAADAVVAGMSLAVSQGQSCQATSRLLAHEAIVDPLADAVQRRVRSLKMGVAYQPGIDMGPLVSSSHLDRVSAMIERAADAGAQVVRCETGGSDRPAGGYYLDPHLVFGADPEAEIAAEEVFGPVLSVHSWSTEDEALALANQVSYGLSATVWSRQIDQALRLAHGVDAGYVWVNDANRHYLGAPFGGTKSSGVGREECPEELDSYTELKSINIRIRPEVEDAV